MKTQAQTLLALLRRANDEDALALIAEALDAAVEEERDRCAGETLLSPTERRLREKQSWTLKISVEPNEGKP